MLYLNYFIIIIIIILFLFFYYIFIIFLLLLDPLNVRSTIEIRRSHLCDFFLAFPFFITFSHDILCCK